MNLSGLLHLEQADVTPIMGAESRVKATFLDARRLQSGVTNFRKHVDRCRRAHLNP